MPCRHHLGQLAATAGRFRNAGCEILIVTQASPPLLRLFLNGNPQPFPVVGDPDRVAYRAFGLERTSWLTFFKPGVIWGYLRLMLRGVGVKRSNPEEDVRQLGGDFLLDQSGEVVWKFTSADPTARPGVEEVLRALETRRPAD
ncbi:MAG: peroxiredoxin-like family protein [Gemmataceae bacterium]